MAVIHRSLRDVKQLIRFPATFSRCEPPSNMPTILELALGWPEGLSFLITLDLCPMHAIGTAIKLKDIQSLEILLRTNFPIFSNRDRCHAGQVHPPVGQYINVELATLRPIADELWRRCQALKGLAIQNLSADEQKAFGLASSDSSQWVPPEVYDVLASRIAVPVRLRYHMTSVYENIIWSSYHKRESLEVWYGTGFRDVDIPTRLGLTPLQNLTSVPQDEEFPDVAFWLLHHRASPIFPPSCSYFPTILFYIVAEDHLIALDLENTNLQAVSSILHKHHAVSDECKCFCSDRGCIAPSLFWRCKGPNQFGNPLYCRRRHRNRGYMLEKFLAMCNLEKTQVDQVLGEICRIELFDRLGMAHTCCRLARARKRESPSDEEQSRMQEEDRELATQLDLLMAEYNKGRLCFQGQARDYWNLWWRVVDPIMPPFSVYEIPYCRPVCGFRKSQVEKRRNRIEREALCLNGYGPSMPFASIIELHFRRYSPLFSCATGFDSLHASGRLLSSLVTIGKEKSHLLPQSNEALWEDSSGDEDDEDDRHDIDSLRCDDWTCWDCMLFI